VRRLLTWVLWLFVVASFGFLGWDRWFSQPQETGRELEPNNTVATAHVLQIGESVGGMIGRRLNNTTPDRDFYRANFSEGEARFLDIHLTPIPNADLHLEIRDDAGLLLALVDREGMGEDEIVKRLPARGDYVTLMVSAKRPARGTLPVENVTDTYRLWTRYSGVVSANREELEQNDTFKRAQPIRQGHAIQGSIDTPGDVDYFAVEFTSQSPAILSFSISGAAGLPLEMRISDNSDRELFHHVYQGQEDHQTISLARTWDMDSAVFVSLRVARGLRASGKYFLSLEEAESGFALEREPNNTSARAQALVYNARQHGRVDPQDPVDIFRLVTSSRDDRDLVLTVGGLGRKPPKLFLETEMKSNKGTPTGEPSDTRRALKIKRARAKGRWTAEFVFPGTRQSYLLYVESAQPDGVTPYQLSLHRRGMSPGDLVDFVQ
jgi:hypothetical protein